MPHLNCDTRVSPERVAHRTANFSLICTGVHNQLMRILLQRLAAVVVLLSWAQVSSAQIADEVIEKSSAVANNVAVNTELFVEP